MIVKLRRKNFRYPDLARHQNYVVIGIEADDLRILNDRGLPYLYPARLFEVVDSSEPDDWLTEFGDDDERYAYPPLLNERGFFEDFFDGEKHAVATFWHVLNQRLAVARATGRFLREKLLPPTRAGKGPKSARQLAA